MIAFAFCFVFPLAISFKLYSYFAAVGGNCNSSEPHSVNIHYGLLGESYPLV